MISSQVKQHYKKGVPKMKDKANKVKKRSKEKYTVVSDHAHQTVLETEKRVEKVLSFPLVKTIERDRMLPRYSAILKRAPEDGVVMDDLDVLQLELEALLSAVVVRSRVLCKEKHTLSSADEKQTKGNNANKIGNASKNGAVNKPIKKFKEKSRELGNTQLSIKFTKVKSIPNNSSTTKNSCLPEYEPNIPANTVSQRYLQPRYDVPNRFWGTVERYCADITLNDVSFLESLAQECEDDLQNDHIPPLGCHYSFCWAREELMNEQEEAHSQARGARKVTVNPSEIQAVFRKGEKASDVSTSGSLKQRLVSVLMEENIKINGNDKGDTKLPFSGDNVMPQSGFFRNFAAGSSASLEKRVRKGLEDQGVLQADNDNKDCEDEILLEIKRCQAELKNINNFNQNQLRRLVSLAKVQIKRQELKRKLHDIDNEVVENYRNVVAAKQKKRPLSKAEEDKCWKSLKERDALVRELDILACNSLD